MGAARGLAIAFGLFAAFFALHIVAGAADLGWLFIIAVALIFASASGFPAIAFAAATKRAQAKQPRIILGIGYVAGTVLTASALWAANGRSFAWWEPPAGAVFAALTSAAMLILMGKRPDRLLAAPKAEVKPGRAKKAAAAR